MIVSRTVERIKKLLNSETVLTPRGRICKPFKEFRNRFLGSIVYNRLQIRAHSSVRWFLKKFKEGCEEEFSLFEPFCGCGR
jgi:hypothetical protein